MTKAMPFLQKAILLSYAPAIPAGARFYTYSGGGSRAAFFRPEGVSQNHQIR